MIPAKFRDGHYVVWGKATVSGWLCDPVGDYFRHDIYSKHYSCDKDFGWYLTLYGQSVLHFTSFWDGIRYIKKLEV